MTESDSSDQKSCAGERCIGKGLLVGLIGGLVGTVVMTQFQNAWSKAQENLKEDQGASDESQKDESENEQKEDATMKAAAKVAELMGYELSHEQKKKLGPVVHYSFGTLQGGVYGTVLKLTGCDGGLMAGLIFGAALFIAADEVGVPAAGLSGKPTEAPLSAHLYGLASHLVYGLSTEFTRNFLQAKF